MLIAAIFWLLEKIRPAIERQYIYIFFLLQLILSFPVKTGIRDYSLSFMQSIVDLFTFSCYHRQRLFFVRPIFYSIWI